MAQPLCESRDPARVALDPLDFRYILGYVTLVEVGLRPRRYRFRLDGSILAMLSYRKQGAFDTQTFDEETMILPLGQGGSVGHLMIAVIPGDLAPEPGKVLL